MEWARYCGSGWEGFGMKTGFVLEGPGPEQRQGIGRMAGNRENRGKGRERDARVTERDQEREMSEEER